MEEEEQGVFTPSLLQGMLSLSCLADLKSAIPSISAGRRPCLVHSTLHSLFNVSYRNDPSEYSSFQEKG